MRGLLWWLALLPAAPVLLPQALYARRATLRLPIARGAREGLAGVGQTGRELRLLVLGESTVMGVGVERMEEGLAAQLARCLAERFSRTVRWQVAGQSGIRLAGLLERLPELPEEEPADFVVVVLGVNDTLGLTGKRHWQEGLGRLIDAFAGENTRVLLAGVPPVGHFRALPRLLRRMFGWRAALLDRWARRAAERKGALHLPVRLPFEPRFLARDGFHPSAAGYRHWAEDMVEQYLESLDTRKDSSPENAEAGSMAGPGVRS